MLLNTLATKNDSDSKKDYNRLNSIMLTSDEWDLIQDLIPILKPFSEATEILGGSTYCTHSIMNPILINIKKWFHPITTRDIETADEINFDNNEMAFDEDIAIEENEQQIPQNNTRNRNIQMNVPVRYTGLIDKIKLNFFATMNHYWTDITSPELLLPSLLDPRMKNLSFTSDSERLQAENLLREKYEESKLQNQHNNSSLFINLDNEKDNERNNERNNRKSIKGLTIFADLKKKVLPADDEIGTYLQLEEIELDANPFTWWYERREKFPILNYLAKKYLAVYACSTASERLFSDAGNVLSAKRTRMCPRLFKKLIFLKRNSKHLDSIYESIES